MLSAYVDDIAESFFLRKKYPSNMPAINKITNSLLIGTEVSQVDGGQQGGPPIPPSGGPGCANPLLMERSRDKAKNVILDICLIRQHKVNYLYS